MLESVDNAENIFETLFVTIMLETLAKDLRENRDL